MNYSYFFMSQIQIDQESLLDTLYATATDETGWDAFLRELVTVTGSRSARMLILNSEADEVRHSIKVNIDDNDHQNYVDYYVNKCPWRLELSQKPTGRLYSTYYDFSCHQPQFYQTEFYNDWARGLDIHHGVCGTAFSNGDNKVQLLIQRTGGQGHYTLDDTAKINSLMPHVRQALRFGLVLQQQHQSLVVARMAAETHCPPFILFDCTGHVSYVSSGCEHLDTIAIAKRHQRSPHTVRSQLKSVFTKTRCRRQSQLAALVLQSPAARYY